MPVGRTNWLSFESGDHARHAAHREERGRFLVDLGLVRSQPIVLVRQVHLPVQPDLPGPFRQQVLFGEAQCSRKVQRPLTDQQHMIGTFHDLQGHLGRMFDIAERRDGTGQMRGAMHHGRVEFDDSLFVRESAVANRRVFWVGLDDGHAFHDRFQRVLPGLNQFVRFPSGGQSVGRRDDSQSETSPVVRRSAWREKSGVMCRVPWAATAVVANPAAVADRK